jgi:glycosyltransferase involved in cell wall biosynthesis
VRIAYICYWDAFRADGVAEKINVQTAEWRVHGNEVEIFCLSPAPPPQGRPAFDGPIFAFEGAAQRIAATLKLERAVRRYAPDCVYLRYDHFVPPLVRTLRSAPCAIEINSGRDELRLRRGGAVRRYGEINRAIMVRGASGLVFVSHELVHHRGLSAPGKPWVVIGNGADGERIRHFPAPANERPRIVFLVGSLNHWHGVDKLLWLAEQMPEADFDIVGPEPTDLPVSLPENVAAHGLLALSEYEPILANSDVAFGTLALHRLNMSEASPLKVRSYLLQGLPVVIAYDDTDFLGDVPWYILKLPNTESNVRDHLADIRSFVARSRGRRVPRELVVERVGAKAKEAARLEFLEQLVRQGS